MSQKTEIKKISDSVDKTHSEFILTVQEPDALLSHRRQIMEYFTDYQYCIISTAEHEDPHQTLVYKQLVNIKVAWESRAYSFFNDTSKSINPGGGFTKHDNVKFNFKYFPGFRNNHDKDKEKNYNIWLINITPDFISFMTEYLSFKVFHNKKKF